MKLGIKLFFFGLACVLSTSLWCQTNSNAGWNSSAINHFFLDHSLYGVKSKYPDETVIPNELKYLNENYQPSILVNHLLNDTVVGLDCRYCILYDVIECELNEQSHIIDKTVVPSVIIGSDKHISFLTANDELRIGHVIYEDLEMNRFVRLYSIVNKKKGIENSLLDVEAGIDYDLECSYYLLNANKTNQKVKSVRVWLNRKFPQQKSLIKEFFGQYDEDDLDRDNTEELKAFINSLH